MGASTSAWRSAVKTRSCGGVCAALLWLLVEPLLIRCSATPYRGLETCGEKLCPQDSFCQESTNICRSCADICDESQTAQHDLLTCHDHCSDYLMNQERSATSLAALILGSVGFVTGITAFLIVLILVCLIYWRPQQLINLLQKKVQPENDAAIGRDESTTAPVSTISDAVKLNIHAASVTPPQSTSHSPSPTTTPVTTSTNIGPPLPARHPSEDSTLDYGAYDNHALSPSPLLDSSDKIQNLQATLPGSLSISTPIRNGIVLNRMESSF